MGSQVIAICPCGLKKEILIGGGMFSFQIIDFFPYYCGNCHDVVQSNLKEANPICPSCESPQITPYNHLELITEMGNKVITRSGDNYLTDGFYKCPKCKKPSLKFKLGGILWD